MLSPPTLQTLRNERPLLPLFLRTADQDTILSHTPRLPSFLRIEVVIPPFPALLGAAEVLFMGEEEDILGDIVPFVFLGF
jgi:hypothetical protein